MKGENDMRRGASSITEIEKSFKEQRDKHQSQLDKFVGRDVIIPAGQYKGRRGMISAIKFNDNGTVVAMIPPYRNAGGPPEQLLWARKDARVYWPISDEDLIKGGGEEE